MSYGIGYHNKNKIVNFFSLFSLYLILYMRYYLTNVSM